MSDIPQPIFFYGQLWLLESTLFMDVKQLTYEKLILLEISVINKSYVRIDKGTHK